MYICPRCRYETPLRANLGIHFNRKKLCKNEKGVDLTDDVKERAMNIKVGASQHATAKNHENRDSENAVHNDMHGSHNASTAHSYNSSKNNTNITLNISNLLSDIPLLIKYENLYDHFCRDMPAKPSIDAKKQRLFGRAIRELDRFQWNAVDGKIPQELDVKEIISMVRSLLDIPSKYKSCPRDIVYNTVALRDEQKKQDFFYDTHNSAREKPNWKSQYEYSILSRIGPMISAFERNTLKLLYQTWDHHKKNEIIMDRLRRLYKIVLCLEFTPLLSVLDPARFVQEALDLDDDHPDFPQAVQRVQDIEILDTCQRMYASAREDIKDDEDDICTDVIDIQEETRRIAAAASKIIQRIFQHECVSNPDFLHKMNHVNENESASASGGDVSEKYDIKYTRI